MSRSEVWTTEEGFVRAETVFPFKQRFRPQVFAVQPQQVERIKNGFGLAKSTVDDSDWIGFYFRR